MAERLKGSTVHVSNLSVESILGERREERKRIRIAEVGKERELEKKKINISTAAGLLVANGCLLHDVLYFAWSVERICCLGRIKTYETKCEVRKS